MVEVNLYYPNSSLINYKTQRPKVQNNQPSKCVTFVLMFGGYMIHFYITYVIVFFLSGNERTSNPIFMYFLFKKLENIQFKFFQKAS
jgi:hypothetical protein